MALRSLMLGKKLRDANKALEEARAKLTEIETREAELEKAIEEAETDEEKAAVEEAVEAFPAEKEAAEEAVKNLEAEVDKLERELAEIENTQAETTDEPEKREAVAPQKEIRIMKRWKEMGYEERDAFVRQDEVQKFLGEVRHFSSTPPASSASPNCSPYILPPRSPRVSFPLFWPPTSQ